MTSLSSKQEIYLEAVYRISARKGAARPKDICSTLHVTNSSVSAAMQKLADLKLINYAPYEIITLTPEGVERAVEVAQRRTVLQDLCTQVLDLDRQTASAVCRTAVHVPPFLLKRIAEFVRFFEALPAGKAAWARWRQNEGNGPAPPGPPGSGSTGDEP